ncbi:MAG: hypothetical protein AB1480_17530 [Nitrospirota bacterium]
MIIFDADILSTFAKILRLDLIKKLFGKIYITPMIKEELLAPLEYGYNFPSAILEGSIIVVPSENEIKSYNTLRAKLGKGEAEAISIAKNRKWLFATNDRVAQREAKENGVGIISLQAILKALLERQLLLKDELIEIVREIRLKDNLVLTEDEIEKILG